MLMTQEFTTQMSAAGSSADDKPQSALRWTLSHMQQIPEVQRAVSRLMEQFAYQPRDQYAIQMGLVEALTNAFRHGNRLDPRKQVYVGAVIDRKQAWIRIEDEGDGFNADEVPDPTLPENIDRPNGRGVYMMRSFLHSVKYNARGNVVTFCQIHRRR